MTARPVSLDRQVADERARHPTPRAATLAGARSGVMIGGCVIVLDFVSRIVPGPWAPQVAPTWPSQFLGWMVALGVSVLLGVALARMGVAIARWRRRVAARFWYSSRAA